MVTFWDQPEDPIEALLRLGERLGYLTYEMLIGRLPNSVVSPENLDRLLMQIDRRGIRLIDEADEPDPPER
jgi:hypothetical protein